ncbi:hypothetical protein FPCIR_14021 [Fusarium pseudocircinatum]|uniref:Uncharacterized protein n=1 Tax=Fusarium pseudocircinatum TaxID=56676 RepID=A0A8H5KJG1_9HYPO|nr:hypothetical protein FPCIR_14021 [Fusarium pseudocircinatum]
MLLKTLLTSTFFIASAATLELTTSSLDEDRVSAGEIAINSDFEGSAKVKRQETNRQKVEDQVNNIITANRLQHGGDHGRRLLGCKVACCVVCGTGLSVAYVAGMVGCGAAVVTEEAISAGTLSGVAVA